MKAINHRLSTASFVVMIGGSWLEVLYCFLFGSIPDQIERIGSKRVIAHRGLSHDIGLWASLILFVKLFPFSPPFLISFGSPHLNEIFLFRTWMLFFPGLLHSLQDLLTPKGVPFLGLRVSLPIFQHGVWKEYLFSWGLVFTALTVHAEKLSSIALTLCKRIGVL